MLNLDAEKQALEPWWFTDQAATGDLPAVEVRFVPIGRVALRNARRAAATAIGSALPDDDDAPLPIDLIEQAGDILSESLLMAGIDDWRGVGDSDGNPVTVTPERLAIFLADPIRFERLDEVYVRPFVMKELEKNGSSPLPNGISAGATQEVDIANRSARRSARAGAKQTRKKAAKKAAPIAKTNCALTQASPSGT
ncbi:hypothetical protein EBBID32_45330 [Sphingobium indicum BiD32]|uniref:Uncharacterized protein n=1 Tax=Sphingobium indicum BiD32 TaxID=1301087 RepID=N1MXC2_9SPHN|nr:hypothetical protein [Sphingobium indicum]CCW20162.1 hypothetical protein EBBID32_45330 [Sphingobium indicum BiD32]